MDTAIVHVDRSEEQPRIIIESRSSVPIWVLCGIIALATLLAASAIFEMHKVGDKVQSINMVQSEREADMTEFFRTHYSTPDGEWHSMKEVATK